MENYKKGEVVEIGLDVDIPGLYQHTHHLEINPSMKLSPTISTAISKFVIYYFIFQYINVTNYLYLLISII